MKILILLVIFSNPIYSQEYMQEFFTVYYSNTKNGLVISEQKLITELSNIQQQLLSSRTLSKAQKLIVQSYTDDAFAKLYKGKAPKISSEWRNRLNQLYNIIIECTNKSPEFLTMTADLRSQIMIYKSFGELIKMSKQNLKDYKIALKKDSTYFGAYLGIALWYYFAPKIGGGNTRISLQYLNKAEKFATTELQKFQLFIWKSQVYFRQNNKDLSEQELNNALAIYPYSSWVKSIQEDNNKGKYFK